MIRKQNYYVGSYIDLYLQLLQELGGDKNRQIRLSGSKKIGDYKVSPLIQNINGLLSEPTNSSFGNNDSTQTDLNVLAQNILELAKIYTPVKTGNLRDSAYCEVNGTTIRVGYDCPYAIYVHENMYYNHPIHIDTYRGIYDCGGSAKFLSNAVQVYLPDMRVEIKSTGDGIYWEHTF